MISVPIKITFTEIGGATSNNSSTTLPLRFKSRSRFVTIIIPVLFVVLWLQLLLPHFCDAFVAFTPTTSSSRTTSTASLSRLMMSGNSSKEKKKKNDDRMLIEFIEEPMSSKEMVGDADKIIGVPPEKDELADLVRCIVRAADLRKADNIVAMRVSKVSTITSFVVFCSGNSRPQNSAITASIKDDVQEKYDLLPGSNGTPEGTPDSGWIVLDYGSVMVHVMTPKSRLFYNVEGKWNDQGAEYMDVTDCILLPNNNNNNNNNNMNNGMDDNDVEEENSKMLDLSEEEDPFWS